MSPRSNACQRIQGPARSSNLAELPIPPRRNVALSAPAALTVPSERERPRGIALVVSPDLRGGRTYLCDVQGHCVHVFDQDYRPLHSFGHYGRKLGEFDSPTDVAIVWLDDAESAKRTSDAAVLVVADCGNHRLQLFELDGTPVCAIGGPAAAAASTAWPSRAGYPFFRLAGEAPLWSPSRLEWRAPYLDVVCAGGTLVRVDLAEAMLPDFKTWLRNAPESELRSAYRRLALHPQQADVPASCLADIAERLQPTRRRGVTLPWRARA